MGLTVITVQFTINIKQEPPVPSAGKLTGKFSRYVPLGHMPCGEEK